MKPGNDFYRYINAKWLRHAHMPSYMSSYGVSEEIEEQVRGELETLLTQARTAILAKPNATLSPSTRLLGTFTQSILHVQSQEKNVRHIQSLLTRLQCIETKEDVGRTIGDLLRYKIETCMSMFTNPSETNSKSNYMCISTCDLGLRDASYYTDSDSFKVMTLNAYGKLLAKLQEEFDVPHLTEFLTLEKLAASALLKSRSDDEWKTTGRGLIRTFPNVPWESIFVAAMRISPEEFETLEILVLSKTWMAYMNTWFKTFSLDNWKSWLAGNLAIFALPLLPPPYDDWHFQLYGHRLRDQTEKTPQKQLALLMCEQYLRGPLGDVFVKKFVPKEIKTKALRIAEEIQDVAAKRLGELEWLTPSAQREARRKILSIHLGVAYPENIGHGHTLFEKTVLSSDSFFKNVLALGEADFLHDVSQIGRPLDPDQWEDPVFSVNAYYYNEGNRLILPAGILRWPFFHVGASDGWNFGGLGAAIGHEMTHAFDMDGKDYDSNGNRRPWWSDTDNAQFMKRAKALEKLYSSTESFGQPLNGKLTLSENIADLGGLGIALAALKSALTKRGVQGAAYKQELCEFFASFAVSWRTKEKRQKALQSLFMDVHAPPFARVNNIVCQFDDWYECFEIQPGDALYKDPKDRIRIF